MEHWMEYWSEKLDEEGSLVKAEVVVNPLETSHLR